MKKTVYQGRYVRVDEEEFGEKRVLYEKAFLRNGVTVIPFDPEDRVILVREHRPQEDPPLRLKLVTGFLEEGMTVEENADRELREEAGFKAGRLRLYAVNRQTGSFNQTNHYVMAADLVHSPLPNPDGHDSILEVLPVGLPELYKMLVEGRFGYSTASYVLLKICIEIREGRFDFIPGLRLP